MFSLKILNDLVMEPVLVKTVSYFKLSALRRSKALELFMKESFLQEEMQRQKTKGKRQKKKGGFFMVQIYTYLSTVVIWPHMQGLQCSVLHQVVVISLSRMLPMLRRWLPHHLPAAGVSLSTFHCLLW